MKIYTKKGDKGTTSLFGGTKVEKCHLRIHAYGTVDELNSTLGSVLTHPLSSTGKRLLQELQHQLFILGADLATPIDKKTRIDRIGSKEIGILEQWIDELEEELPTLKTFILPGGSPAGATLHLARTICRRAERAAVSLAGAETVSEETMIYLNRLSDLLFVMARFENQKAGVPETPWISKSEK